MPIAYQELLVASIRSSLTSGSKCPVLSRLQSKMVQKRYVEVGGQGPWSSHPPSSGFGGSSLGVWDSFWKNQGK